MAVESACAPGAGHRADRAGRCSKCPEAPIVLDVRSRSQYERDGQRIPGDVRVPTDEIENWAARWLADHPDGEPKERPIAAYCA